LRRSLSAEDLFLDSLDILRAEKRMHPVAAGGFAEVVLREVCGDEVGSIGAWFAHSLALLRHSKALAAHTSIKATLAITKSALDRFKAAARELERDAEIIKED
jgi:hypothetical protein